MSKWLAAVSLAGLFLLQATASAWSKNAMAENSEHDLGIGREYFLTKKITAYPFLQARRLVIDQKYSAKYNSTFLDLQALFIGNDFPFAREVLVKEKVMYV